MSIIGTRWLLDFASQGIAEPVDGLPDARVQGHLHRHLHEARHHRRQDDGPAGGRLGPRDDDQHRPLQEGRRRRRRRPGTTSTTPRRKSPSCPTTFGFGLQGKEIETDAYYYYALWTFGGDILRADGKSGLDSPEALAAATFYKKMIDQGLTEPSPTNYSREDVFNLFKQGKVGTIFTFPMLIPQIKAEAPNLHYEVLPFPARRPRPPMA